jgi:hypothetical protein
MCSKWVHTWTVIESHSKIIHSLKVKYVLGMSKPTEDTSTYQTRAKCLSEKLSLSVLSDKTIASLAGVCFLIFIACEFIS